MSKKSTSGTGKVNRVHRKATRLKKLLSDMERTFLSMGWYPLPPTRWYPLPPPKWDSTFPVERNRRKRKFLKIYETCENLSYEI